VRIAVVPRRSARMRSDKEASWGDPVRGEELRRP
jgi:hypothetical protein